MQSGNTSLGYWRPLIGHLRPDPYRPESRTRAARASAIESSDAAVDPGATDEMTKPFQVYIVEDSPIVEQWLASEVERAGAEVSGSSADAQAAIGDVFALQPDLILIDIGLESGSGFDVLKTLQDHSLAPAAIKVVLTNFANAEYRNRSVSLGADGFFDKTSETAQALAMIDAAAAEGRSSVSPLL